MIILLIVLVFIVGFCAGGLVTLKGVANWIQREHPDLVNELVMEFGTKKKEA